jgi:hypothetical protein
MFAQEGRGVGPRSLPLLPVSFVLVLVGPTAELLLAQPRRLCFWTYALAMMGLLQGMVGRSINPPFGVGRVPAIGPDLAAHVSDGASDGGVAIVFPRA